MPEGTRRGFLGVSLSALPALAAAVKPVGITGVDFFDIDVPVTKSEAAAGVYHRFPVARIATDAGVRGYSFLAPPARELPQIRELLVGKDPFAVEQHLRNGLGKWAGVEHALWDAIGKIANQPVYRLLGGSAASVKPYVTCVWKGNPDQSQVPFRDQVEMALKIQRAGFHGMKIRVWRPNPMDDVEVCRQIRAATGPNFSIMFDRTAHAPQEAGQKIWDYDTGLRVARALEKAGACWLEEPFAREDYEKPARLAAAVDLPITGGEGYLGLEPFRQCLLHRTYDILQPDGRNCGGILVCRKVATLAEAFHVRAILHGTMSLMLAGWVQASLAIGAEWQELALVTPPLLPEEQWAPALKLLNTSHLFTIAGGAIQAPAFPGLGLDLNEEALERYRVTA